VPDLPACPACRSTLLQPQRRRSDQAPSVTVDLRCAECSAWTRGSYSASELVHLDRQQVEGRLALLQVYERCVSESMEALAQCLAVALERDLVGADDFAPRRAGCH
jgi:hypothetical protein